MANRRLKLTAFSRFLIVMVFLVPLAYIGASYYNGEDGIQNIKELVGMNETRPATSQDPAVEISREPGTASDRKTPPSVAKKMQSLENEVASLKAEVLKLKTEIAELKSR